MVVRRVSFRSNRLRGHTGHLSWESMFQSGELTTCNKAQSPLRFGSTMGSGRGLETDVSNGRWYDVAMSTCKIEGCESRVIGWGWCESHYRRWKKYGDPLFSGVPLAERFLKRVDKNGPMSQHHLAYGQCWQWIGNVNKSGYGIYAFSRFEKRQLAHRLSYELFVAPIPDGLVIDHRCRNTGCVRPDHLQPVTRRLNTLRGFSPPALRILQTHCKRGHKFNEENTYVNPKNRSRHCRICAKELERIRRVRAIERSEDE